jgi:hypothetical protein
MDKTALLLFNKTNQYRASKGLTRIACSSQGNLVANEWSKTMCETYVDQPDLLLNNNGVCGMAAPCPSCLCCLCHWTVASTTSSIRLLPGMHGCHARGLKSIQVMKTVSYSWKHNAADSATRLCCAEG